MNKQLNGWMNACWWISLQKQIFIENRIPILPRSKAFLFLKNMCKIQKLLFIVITRHGIIIHIHLLSYYLKTLKNKYYLLIILWNTSVEARFPGFEFWVCCWSAVGAWASYLAFLCSISSCVKDLMYLPLSQNCCED